MKAQRAVVVTLKSNWALASHLYVLRQSFLCYVQGTVKQAFLCGDRSCCLLTLFRGTVFKFRTLLRFMITIHFVSIFRVRGLMLGQRASLCKCCCYKASMLLLSL